MKTLGLHIIATLISSESLKLNSFEELKMELNALIPKYNLNNLGEVYHNFHPQGFTAIVCLSESHISIHTWPELNKVNLDIYLSNHNRVNDNTVRQIFDQFVRFFNAQVQHKTEIIR